ncbi:ThiF family adenylyltransferase [Bacillus paramycoides]|uniref:HesA/MoeB/ThiF family protein n=1 Tax=Bacillus paramycoides TaxID=2026194 RepID=UPI002E205909|nr:ThiF family adenylyltransferase [Bacillus paramycoides]
MIYKIKDSVDLFLSGNVITAYFMNTRMQKHFRVNDESVRLLEHYDGKKSIEKIAEQLKMDRDMVLAFSQYLEKLKILVRVPIDLTVLSDADVGRFDRQLNYFSEFLETTEEAHIAQHKIQSTRFLIFGCGAIGGNIAIQLAMAGASHFILFDYDKVEESDAARHIYYCESGIGESKTLILKNAILEINSNAIVETINEFMHPKSEIEHIIQQVDFVINTLDEPYIGYTSAKISRICTPLGIPHYIAGGFDAHLASTGELIIPGITPCVECYASHFKVALRDWKPKAHPIVERYAEIGGLSSMALFSSSFAAIEIIKYITNIIEINDSYKTRGELLFKELSLTYIQLEKNHNCKVCGKLVETV